MAYFSVWGPDCERFHEVVDAVIVEDDLGKRLFVGPNANDAVMTTWHADDTLAEALDYFAILACPTDGFTVGSDYWIAMCVHNPEWATTIRRQLEYNNRQ